MEHSQACVQIFSWHKRPRHPFWSELNFRRSRLHRLGLRRMCGQSQVNNRILFQIRQWSNFVEVKTSGVQNHPTKAKYVVASDAAKEALWLSRLAHTFRQVNSDSAPVVYSDSKSVVGLSKNPVHHNASKNIEVRYQGKSV